MFLSIYSWKLPLKEVTVCYIFMFNTLFWLICGIKSLFPRYFFSSKKQVSSYLVLELEVGIIFIINTFFPEKIDFSSETSF